MSIFLSKIWYANQQEYYNAIAASSAEGQSGPFIDFMLNEILKTLQKNVKEGVPNKLPDKVPNKSELSVLRLLTDNPRLTRIELADFDILHLFSNLVVIYQE